VSVDVAVMERSDRVAVVPATFDWDDVGAWHSLFRTRPRDGADNAVIGDGHVVEGRGNVVFAEGGPVVVFGVDNLVAVRTHGITLVTSRERAPDLKSLLDRLPASVREIP
jgi:mannose-1-phosphate guanylyltransferase